MAKKPITHDALIAGYFDKYAKNNRPIEVSFRKILPEFASADRATHLIHTYPAKLLMHIPHIFINNSILSKPGSVVLDPFCGSGTVLLEAVLANRNALGADSNPIARLISEVKTTKYDPKKIEMHAETLKKIHLRPRDVEIDSAVDINFWFSKKARQQLDILHRKILTIENSKYRKFFLVCFSNCVRKVSFADPRVSVPVKLNPAKHRRHGSWANTTRKIESEIKTMNPEDKFFDIVEQNIRRFREFTRLYPNQASAKIVSNDARELTNCLPQSLKNQSKISTNFVDLIITSPPYAGAQKYIRASSLNLSWLGYAQGNQGLKRLENLSIGREHYKMVDYGSLNLTGVTEADKVLRKIHKINPLRSHIAGNYLIEMEQALQEAVRTLKPGGYLVLIAANNQVCGLTFETQKYLMQIAMNLGLNLMARLVDDIQSYGLMTKRNKTAGIITREWILIFQK